MSNKRNQKILLAVLVVLFLIAAFFGTIVAFITDYWWFEDLGYTEVFFKQLFTEIQIAVPCFIVLMALSSAYLFTMKKGYLKNFEVIEGSASDKSVKRLTLLLAVVFSLILTMMVTNRLWKEILYASNSTDFNVSDPIFDQDISFYIFRLDLLDSLCSIGFILLAAFAVLTVIYFIYLIIVRKPDFGPDPDAKVYEAYDANGYDSASSRQGMPNMFGALFGSNVFRRPPGTRLEADIGEYKLAGKAFYKHLVLLGVLFFILIALSFALRQFDLLFSASGVVYGAGFTDITVSLNVYRVQVVLALLSAFLLVVFSRKRQFKRILIAPVAMIVLSVLATFAEGGVQSLIVAPDELNKETPYLENSIKYTQLAYELQNVKEQDFTANSTLTADNILNNQQTISNIRINDFEPSKQFYNQTQTIRTYYTFNDVDVDRYNIDGLYTQTFLSAREINSSNLGNSVSWLTEHLKYTHGYGITLSRVDAVTATGQPEMVVSGIPPVSETADIAINTPQIYFGEMTRDYVITNTNEAEFDYPSGQENVYNKYDGSRGIKLDLIKRILYAVRERSVEILISNNISDESRLLYDRDIATRVSKLAPFLIFDSDPYIVVSDSGDLYWIVDAYTTSARYPYSQPVALSGSYFVNYMRNPVKVTINAYDGSVNFYKLMDEPVADTIEKIYPGVFKDISEMPDGLRDHVRYSNTMLDVQAKTYQRYHMSDVGVFYQNEDRWSIATDIYGQSEVEMVPNYFIMKLPGGESEEFISMIPFTPYGRKNMTGMLVARSDGGAYGELILYRLPKDRVIYGPMQIESQIDQNTQISQDFSLWNSSGSTYTRGDMFVIPIDNSIIYVEPVYLESSTDTSLPEVKRVIVAYHDQIAYSETLAGALDSLFNMGQDYVSANTAASVDSGENVADRSNLSGLSMSELANRANEAFNNAVNAQRGGDWASYGAYLDELQTYLDQMTGNSAVSVVETAENTEAVETVETAETA